MKAIIIEDKDARALLDSLQLEKVTAKQAINTESLEGRKTLDELIQEVHVRFHYMVVRWLQEQGADCIRR